MRHLKKGRKFGRTRDERRALLRTLAFQLVMRERIRTSEANAKELRPIVESYVTRAKSGRLADRRALSSRLPEAAAAKLMSVIAPRFQNRPGGYIRVIRVGARRSDASEQAIIEFVQ